MDDDDDNDDGAGILNEVIEQRKLIRQSNDMMLIAIFHVKYQDEAFS